jgi:hypothetical protein
MHEEAIWLITAKKHLNKKGELMTIRKEIDLEQPLTAEQKQMLEALKARPVQPDQDCPELTAEQLHQLVNVSEMRRDKHR